MDTVSTAFPWMGMTGEVVRDNETQNGRRVVACARLTGVRNLVRCQGPEVHRSGARGNTQGVSGERISGRGRGNGQCLPSRGFDSVRRGLANRDEWLQRGCPTQYKDTASNAGDF